MIGRLRRASECDANVSREFSIASLLAPLCNVGLDGKDRSKELSAKNRAGGAPNTLNGFSSLGREHIRFLPYDEIPEIGHCRIMVMSLDLYLTITRLTGSFDCALFFAPLFPILTANSK